MIALLAALLSAGAAEPRLQPGPAHDAGYAAARLGHGEEAERALRLAIQLKPSRWSAYASLADLLSEAPDRWDHADQTLALLARGLALAPASGKVNLALRVANFERAVGRTGQARERLLALAELKPGAEQGRRIRELLDRIADEERARALADWPEPAVSTAQEGALRAAAQQLAEGEAREALAAADALCAQQPAWRAARWLRARALDANGRVDEEARDLRILTQLSPSHARAWRRLGEILSEQGGLLEADRADEALRQALALEPAWTQLWLLRAKVALRQGRAQDALRALDRFGHAGGSDPEAARLLTVARAQAALPGQAVAEPRPPSREPSLQARALFEQAFAVDTPPESTKDLLMKAIADSPAFIEAAAALFALTGTLPQSTPQALLGDGPGLLELAAQVRRAGAPPAVVAPFIDRAVELGAPEARYARAALRVEQADRGGALDDLLAYAAAQTPQHLEEARALRAQLLAPPRSDVSALQARLRLAEDRPEAALAALGSRCEVGAPEERLIALGKIHEFSGELPQAVACYRLAAPAPEALQRLSRVAERQPSPGAEEELRKAAALDIAPAHWALARIELQRARSDEALRQIEAFLAAAPDDDPGLADARAARDQLLRSSTAAATARRRQRTGMALGAAALLLALLAFFRAGAPLESALRKAPRLFPQAARAVGEVRHDVIKHRASVLGMAREHREDVARSLLSPEPASQAVAQRYETLRKAARAQGVPLRRLRREPVFGPLVRDLARAEALLQAPSGGEEELARIDRRIREAHSARLAALLRLAPRTRLDAGALSGWIRDVEAEVRRGGAPWKDPSILLQGMAVEFPVERSALSLIFANLLRNAQAAAAGGEVIVRLGEERDAAGRNLAVLLVGDSSANLVSLAAIEQRESGRGLALVRDLTREWQGHLVVRAEEPPWKKAVGACFPAPPS